MKIMDLLNDIENGKIEDGTIFEVIGDFFYKLIVIDKNLYCINEMTKQLEILDSKYIGRFDNRQYEIVKLSNKVEEEKKLPEKYNNSTINGMKCAASFDALKPYIKLIMTTQNGIIDYIKSKGK